MVKITVSLETAKKFADMLIEIASPKMAISAIEHIDKQGDPEIAKLAQAAFDKKYPLHASGLFLDGDLDGKFSEAMIKITTEMLAGLSRSENPKDQNSQLDERNVSYYKGAVTSTVSLLTALGLTFDQAAHFVLLCYPADGVNLDYVVPKEWWPYFRSAEEQIATE